MFGGIAGDDLAGQLLQLIGVLGLGGFKVLCQ